MNLAWQFDFCVAACSRSSWAWRFLKHISQGRVATRLRSGGIFNNLPLNQPVKEFWKSVKIWRSYRHQSDGLLFWSTQYTPHAKGQFWREKLSAREMKEQDQQFFNNSIRALEKRQTKWISVAGNYVEKWQNMVYISCDCVSLRIFWKPLVYIWLADNTGYTEIGKIASFHLNPICYLAKNTQKPWNKAVNADCEKNGSPP